MRVQYLYIRGLFRFLLLQSPKIWGRPAAVAGVRAPNATRRLEIHRPGGRLVWLLAVSCAQQWGTPKNHSPASHVLSCRSQGMQQKRCPPSSFEFAAFMELELNDGSMLRLISLLRGSWLQAVLLALVMGKGLCYRQTHV